MILVHLMVARVLILLAVAMVAGAEELAPRRWAVVTGASSGLGASLAKLAASNGYNVLLAARRSSRLETLASEISASQPGAQVACLTCDVTATEGQNALFDATRGRDLGLLVLNAGICETGSLWEQSTPQVQAMLELNVRSNAVLLRRFSSVLASAPQGSHILLIGSSSAAAPGVPSVAVYAASKAFLRSLAAGVGAEHRASKTGVSVTYALPSAIDTEFAARSGLEQSAIFSLPGVRRIGGIVMSSDAVASKVLHAALRGRPEVVPGFLPKLYVGMADRRLLPAPLARALAAFSFGPSPLVRRAHGPAAREAS